MFNPDDPPKKVKPIKRVEIMAPQAEPPRKIIEANELVGEREMFRHYCETSVSFREAQGIRIRKGKAEIIDQKRLSSLVPWEQDILREVCQKLIREYKEASKFWKDEK